MNKKIFSGVQPTGNLHLGNYLGAIKNFVELNNAPENECVFCVVDLHAITIKQNPEELKNNNLFEFNKTFFKQFVKIIFASIIMGIFFQYLILLFENQLSYAYFFKSAYLLLCVLFAAIFYFALSYFIKAFNYQDIKLKY